MYAFVNDSGNYGFKFDQYGISTHFIVTALLVNETKINPLSDEIDAVYRKYFQTDEMEFSSIDLNHKRRLEILDELMKCEFQIFSVVVDKQMLLKDNGHMSKESFYKFINNLVHKELRNAFKKLVVCADENGGNDYLKSFCDYVRDNEDIPNLFGEREFYFENTKSKSLIWFAEFLSETLSFVYEEGKKTGAPNYLKILDKKLIRIEYFPKVITKYVIENSNVSEEKNNEILTVCLQHVQAFLNKYEKSTKDERVHQVIVLKYLCFRFLHHETRKYIPTRELINNLKYRTGKVVSMHYFRTRIIAKLRDEGVIIASSSKGYKIPSKVDELYDFINHGTTIIMPLLDRLKKCRDNIKIGTDGKLDLFDNSEYKTLKGFFDI